MLPFLKFDYNYYYIHRYLTGTKELYLNKYMQYKKINKILIYWWSNDEKPLTTLHLWDLWMARAPSPLAGLG